jgi:3-oxoacyl-[acyl-carrier protein] reductase
VAITGRDQAKLEEAARTLGVFAIHADVTNESDVLRTYREVLAKFGDLDILVNNAGVGVFKNLVDFDRASFDTVFATNVVGAMLMAREAAKRFVRRTLSTSHLRLLCVARRMARCIMRANSRYVGMTECWRAELRKHNIRVMLVNLSEVLTNFSATAGIAQKTNESKLRGEEIAHAVRAILEMDDRGSQPSCRCLPRIRLIRIPPRIVCRCSLGFRGLKHRYDRLCTKCAGYQCIT